MKLVAQGTYGKVYVAGAENETIAIKVTKIGDEKGIPASYLRELTVMNYCFHPNILKNTNLFIDSAAERFMLYLPYALCDLKRFVEEMDYHCLDLMKGLAKGLYYLEQKNILHGDLKPENILVFTENNTDYTLRIADFGIACFEVSGSLVSNEMSTFFWKAPEELLNIYITLARGFATISWIFGAICYYIYHKTIPFEISLDPVANTINHKRLFKAMKKGIGIPIKESRVFKYLTHCISIPVHDERESELVIPDLYLHVLMQRCLQWNPGDRITMYEICSYLELKVETPLSALQKLKANEHYCKLPRNYSKGLVIFRQIYENTEQKETFREIFPLALNIYKIASKRNYCYMLAYLSLSAKLKSLASIALSDRLVLYEKSILKHCNYRIWSTTTDSYLELFLEKEDFDVLDAARVKLVDFLLEGVIEDQESLARRCIDFL